MLFRKRERFERTDVPTPGPYTNVIGGVVIAVVAVALFFIVSNVADRVSKEVRLDDSTLGKQISAQSSMSVTDDSYSISKDTFTKILLLTVANNDDVKKGTQLTSAQMLVIREHAASEDDPDDASSVTGDLVTIPTSVKVSSTGSVASLAELCAASGPSACVAPLNTATNVKFSHVIVSTADVTSRVAALAGTDSSKLLDDSLDLVLQIRTDMTAAELVSLANKISQAGGVQSFDVYESPTVADTAQADDGSTYETGYQAIDKTGLCADLGTLVSNE